MTNAKFKHSGIEWLGEIPKHWGAWRIRDIFEIKNGYTPSKANQEFWENGTLPWFRMDDIRTNGRILNDSLQHITQKAVEPNGLFPANSLIIATTATIGEHALITVDSLANQQFTFLIKKVNCKVELDMKFVFYYGYVLGAWCKSNVNVSNFPAVDMDRFRVFKIPLPPIAEQKQIAEFLDSKCEKIAEFISKKQKLIALLKEQKQALINEAVCGRLYAVIARQQGEFSPSLRANEVSVAIHTFCHTDTPLCHTSAQARSIQNNQNRDISPTAQYDNAPRHCEAHEQSECNEAIHKNTIDCHADFDKSACNDDRGADCHEFANANSRNDDNTAFKFKPSGVEWLGEIPVHWEIVRLGLAFKNIGSGTTPQSNETKYYENGNIAWVNSSDLNNDILKETKYKVTQKAINDYQILKLFPKDSLIVALYGATIGKVAILDFEACVNQACCVLGKSSLFLTKFIFYWFLAKRNDIVSLAFGGGQANISQEIIRNLKIPLPPIAEQKQIAEFLDSKCEKIDKAVALIEREIESIKEYKTSLIDNAVRGRINV